MLVRFVRYFPRECLSNNTLRQDHAELPTCAQDEYVGAAGSVIAADFYRAGALLPLPDEEVVARVLRNLQFCEPGFLGAKVPSCFTDS